MPTKKIKHFLDESNIKYTVISHSTAYTAQEVAQLSHVTGKELAKTIILDLDGQLTMVVVPATKHVDFEYLKEAANVEHAELVPEERFQDRFPDCEIGAMPPFGNLYGMKVIVDERLSTDKEIAFNAGNHRELIRMTFKDFEALTKPQILDVTAFFREKEKSA